MEREDRYLVLKRKDIEQYLPRELKGQLVNIAKQIDVQRKADGKTSLEYLIVEKDWPEYEPTWAAIEQRMFAESDPDVGN